MEIILKHAKDGLDVDICLLACCQDIITCAGIMFAGYWWDVTRDHVTPIISWCLHYSNDGLLLLFWPIEGMKELAIRIWWLWVRTVKAFRWRKAKFACNWSHWNWSKLCEYMKHFTVLYLWNRQYVCKRIISPQSILFIS